MRNRPAGGTGTTHMETKSLLCLHCRAALILEKGGLFVYLYIVLPTFCGIVPAVSPSDGPCWEYQSMITRRNEHPTGYK